MIDSFFRKIKKIVSSRRVKIDPDEIFLDSSNLPSHDRYQFEGRIERPIEAKNIFYIKMFFLLFIAVFFYRVVDLEIRQGEYFSERSDRNHLSREVIFAHRGTIADRNDVSLAWNEESGENAYPKRIYLDTGGFSSLLGYIKYPKKDSSGNFYSLKTTGEDGIEKYYNDILAGVNGVKLTEIDVKGNVESQSTVEPPTNGEKVTLSIDSRMQNTMYTMIKKAVEDSGYGGGGGVMMDANTGEVIALVTYPEYSSIVMTEGKDKEAIESYFSDKGNPFLDRAVLGLYAPGSVVKPFIAVGVMNENIIDPYKSILSTGSISIPNPYDPEKPSIFKDWKAHGYVDMRQAIAASSDVYFYAVGGGYMDQKGIGIAKIDDYLKRFLYTVPTESFFAGPAGTIPSPEWKAKNFNGDPWRLGDTYHTTIGQYGFQVTVLQVARAMTGLASSGRIVSPSIIKGEQGKIDEVEGISKDKYIPTREGMRLAVTDSLAKVLDIPGTEISAKTGTAEIGVGKKYVNSWVAGFWPYEDPKYVFSVVLEKGPIERQTSALTAMSNIVWWAKENAPEYVVGEAKKVVSGE